MKKIWLFIIWLCTIFFVWNFTQANSEYEYTNLNITANVLIDGTMDVKEDFTADFFVSKHGIIRTIPLNYSAEWQEFHIDISNINVQWKTFKKSKSNWEIEIRIWNANKTIIWEQYYPISYKVYWLIRNFSGMGYAELYWNLVWYDFDTNINKIRAELILPKAYTWFTANNFLITTDWKTNTIQEFQWIVDWSQWNKIIVTYDKWLPAFQWITLSIKFPNNYFDFDHKKQAKLIWSTWDNRFNEILNGTPLYLWVIMCLCIVSVTIIAVFKKLGDSIWEKINTKFGFLKWEFAKKFPVIIQYEPPKWLTSAEVWLLLHRNPEMKDMLSLIYKWAAEWLIKISLGDDTSFFGKLSNNNTIIITKIKNIPEEAPSYEKEFFKDLVHWEKTKITKTTNLYNRLHSHMYTLGQYGKNKWWFQNPKKIFKKEPSFIVFLWCFILFMIIISSLPSIALLLLFWWIFIKTSVLRMKETEEWAKLISHILWYREFLKTCDENKLRLFLAKDPLYFDKILPYAVVFGLETKLLKKIEPIMQEMNVWSSWYNQIYTVDTINRIISSSARHSVPSSSSYSSSRWFSGWSSFWWWFSFWWWWGWGWWRSW